MPPQTQQKRTSHRGILQPVPYRFTAAQLQYASLQLCLRCSLDLDYF
jgi:hypothetical protein